MSKKIIKSKKKKLSTNNKINENTPVSVAEKIINTLDLPTGMLSEISHMELASNKEASIDGCSGVLEYDENLIRINLGKTSARFLGKNLTIKSLTKNNCIITGFITSIEFV